MFRLLVAIDFSDTSRKALSAAVEVASRVPSAELVLLHVSDSDDANSFEDTEKVSSELRAWYTTARGERTLEGVTPHCHIVRGPAAEQIVAQASTHQTDLVIVGTHGRRGLERLLLGSVAEAVVRLSPCSVLTVKPRE